MSHRYPKYLMERRNRHTYRNRKKNTCILCHVCKRKVKNKRFRVKVIGKEIYTTRAPKSIIALFHDGCYPRE